MSSSFSLPAQLKNHYILARHGYSLANDAHLICSNPDIAIPETGGPLNTGYGLHERGRHQVKQSADELACHLTHNNDLTEKSIRLFCSPFLRTRQTAAIFYSVLQKAADSVDITLPIANDALRERWFGEFDMTHDDNYQQCWQPDGEPGHGEQSQYGIEAPSSVAERAVQFILQEIEGKMEGHIVVLVAHGDICQMLQAIFLGKEAWQHREMEHMHPAQWRDMTVHKE
ncbi:histidine phosphatase superfamily [Spinellus fusiger]|nr:histidine phosphatase superfamily [Spinellus fusiger]